MDRPVEEPSKSVALDRRPFQYSLRTLLELITVVCLGLSLWRWGGETLSRAPEFYLGLAAAIMGAGLIMRRRTWILGGAAIAVALFCGLTISAGWMNFESHHKLTARSFGVLIKVADPQKNSPIPGAIVEITSGSPSARITSKNVTEADGMVLANVGVSETEQQREIDISVSAAGYKTVKRRLCDLSKIHVSSNEPSLNDPSRTYVISREVRVIEMEKR